MSNNLYKKMTKYFLFLALLFNTLLNAQSLEKTESFFENWKEVENDKTISWYYLNVPENYQNPNGKKIKLAITVLHSPKKNNTPTLFINGGPGGGSIDGLWRWLGHPLREISDIVLIDNRGTGFSTPRLCPELGNDFFKILAKDQKKDDDEKDKVDLALRCKENIVNNGIDINSYNDESVANDLHNLKTELKINNWNIISVSYGTVFSQFYSNKYPNDINKMIIDSGIYDINEYYEKNHKSYVNSLEKLFNNCKRDCNCNNRYPNLKEVYNSVLRDLEKSPLNIDIQKEIIKSEKFIYNAEDFKTAIQQSLYNPQVISILPQLIYSFKEKDKEAIRRFTTIFGRALKLDYGTYYCFTCNDLTLKSLKEKNYLSFYKSDIDICNKWKKTKLKVEISKPSKKNIDVLIFSGKYDPITPLPYSILISKNYDNAKIVILNNSSHGSSSSVIGNNIIKDYLTNDKLKFDKDKSDGEKSKIEFVDIASLSGIAKLIEYINKNPKINLIPILLSVIMMLYLTFYISKNKKNMSLILARINFTFGLLYVLFILFCTLKTFYTNPLILLIGLENCFSKIIIISFKVYFIFSVSLLFYILKTYKEMSSIYLLIISTIILNLILMLNFGIF